MKTLKELLKPKETIKPSTGTKIVVALMIFCPIVWFLTSFIDSDIRQVYFVIHFLYEMSRILTTMLCLSMLAFPELILYVGQIFCQKIDYLHKHLRK